MKFGITVSQELIQALEMTLEVLNCRRVRTFAAILGSGIELVPFLKKVKPKKVILVEANEAVASAFVQTLDDLDINRIFALDQRVSGSKIDRDLFLQYFIELRQLLRSVDYEVEVDLLQNVLQRMFVDLTYVSDNFAQYAPKCYGILDASLHRTRMLIAINPCDWRIRNFVLVKQVRKRGYSIALFKNPNF